MKKIKVNTKQAEFITSKAYKSPTSEVKYVIFIGDGNDDAYTLNISEILEVICISWFNIKNGVKYIVHKDWIEHMQEVCEGELENMEIYKNI